MKTFQEKEGFPLDPIEKASRDELQALQLERLKWSLKHAYDNVEHYRKKFDAAGAKPGDLKTLDDLAKFPLTNKSDLRETYPFGMFAVPMDQVVRIHASSGTTGKPIVVAYTREDLQVWQEVIVRTLASCGVHRGDVIQNAYGYGLFTGGLGLHYGGEGLGATVIPISGGNTERQLMVMQDFGVTVICSTPSYFLHLIEASQAMNKPVGVRVGVFGAEPWSESMRQRIQADTGIRAFDIYGLSEIIGPGVGAECQAR